MVPPILRSLFAALALAFSSSAALCEPPDEPSENTAPPLMLGPVDVLGEQPPDIERLWSETEGTQGPASVADLLEQNPSVNVAVGTRGEAEIAHRGFLGRQIGVELDGITLQSPYDGQTDLSMWSSVGLASLDYAGVDSHGSIGGTIQITSLVPGHLRGGRLSLESGPPGDLKGAMLLGNRWKRLGWVVGGSGDVSPGFPLSRAAPERLLDAEGQLRDNSDRLHGGLWGSAALDLEGGRRLEASYRYNQGRHGVPQDLHDDFPRYWRWTDWRSHLAYVRYRSGGGDRLKLDSTVYAHAPGNTLASYDDDSFKTQDTARGWTSEYRDSRVGLRQRGRWRLGHPRDRLSLFWDADLHRDSHAEDQWPESPQEEVDLTQWGAFATVGARWSPADPVLLTARAGTEFLSAASGTSGDDARGVLGGAVHAEFRSSDDSRWHLSLSRRHRMPTLKERFSSAFSYRIPNPDLAAETSWNVELGWEKRWPGSLKFELSPYLSFLRGLIEERPTGTGTVQMVNLDDSLAFGVQGAMKWKPARSLQLSLLGDWLESRDPSGDHLLPYRPRFSVGARVRLRLTDEVVVRSDVRWVGPQELQDRATGDWGRLGQYAVWNLALHVAPGPAASGWLSISNVTDTYYQGRAGLPDPGRRLALGFELVF